MGYNGKPYSLLPPARHQDVVRYMLRGLGHPAPVDGAWGYLASDGSFVEEGQASGNGLAGEIDEAAGPSSRPALMRAG